MVGLCVAAHIVVPSEGLALGRRQARPADDVELHAVTDDLSRDVCAYGPQQALDGRVAELADVPARDTERMVMVLDAGKAVLRSAVWQRQLAQDARFEKELDRPVDCRAADSWELFADVLGAEALLFPIH